MSRMTLKNEIQFTGIGLHSGQSVRVTLSPARSGSGYVFSWGNDFYSITQAAHTGDGRGTILTFGSHRIMTVEHLLAALSGCGVDDVVISSQGQEIPLLDGSALDFLKKIQEIGLQPQSGEVAPLRISAPVSVSSDDERKLCIALPSDKLRFTYVLEYGDNLIGSQVLTVEPKPETFSEELARCRTFCLYEEIEQMQKMGLARGGTVETALIVRGHEVLTPGGLRCPDEFVRHKILDMMGDLTLLGRPVLGHFVGIRAGHAMHQKLVDRLQHEA